MWLLYIYVVYCVQLLVFVEGGRDFRLGRSKGGNLGAPSPYTGEKLPPAQWFKQKLDHSNPSDLRTWKQNGSGAGVDYSRRTINGSTHAINLIPLSLGPQVSKTTKNGGNRSHASQESNQHLLLEDYSVLPRDVQRQRYFVNDSFYDFKNPGPVFLMIGGEGPADARWMVKGAWIEYAKKFKALCINLEHRFYGESHPTEDLSVKNLQYLSSSLALADLAYFISAMNAKYKFNKEVKWVAFGGSYPGSLAAWLRLKYPHLVFAAVSSSGPLLAKVNFMEYYQVVIRALREKTGNEECVSELKMAHEQITMMMKTHPDVIEKEYRVCKPFANATANDIKNFYNSIADDFADVVQYNEDNRISNDERYRNITINTVCSLLTASKRRPAYKRLAAFNSIMLDKSNQTCMDYSYQNMIDELRNTSWGSAGDEGGRQWMYQTCTEFGFYQTSSGEVDVFGNKFNLNFFIKQCQEIFGSKYNLEFVQAAADWTNDKYGALGISVSRVVFVHGSVDPWHALGITSTQDNDAPAIYIQGTAHCANMYPPSESDSAELMEARLEIEQYLTAWVGLP